MRRSIVVAAVLLAIAFALVGGPSLLFSPTTAEIAPATDPDPEIVYPEGAASGFWPYLSAREAHDRRSPINVVVLADAETVLRVLAEEADGDWEEADGEHFEDEGFTDPVDPADGDAEDGDETNGTLEVFATEIPWTQATGTSRYAYVDPGPDEDARWTTETGQVQDGDYYGQRYHIRFYESPNPDDRWVAMQAHTEHFDWFTLRHRVDGVEAAQSRVEADLMSSPTVDDREDVARINLANGGPSDADGWATRVDLAALAILPALVGLAARGRERGRTDDVLDRYLTAHARRRLDAATDRLEPGHLVLAGTILVLLLGVRVAGVALERRVDVLSMHAIAALLYPAIALGIPAATLLVARGLERRLDAAVVAATSLAVAIWLDYGLLGVSTLPIDVVVQRFLVVVAIGLIAAGAAGRGGRGGRLHDALLVGVALWTLVLVGTLFGYL